MRNSVEVMRNNLYLLILLIYFCPQLAEMPNILKWNNNKVITIVVVVIIIIIRKDY